MFFGKIDQDISLVIPAKSTIMSPPMDLVSEKGFGFLLGVLGKLMVAYPTLAGGGANLVPFDISSVITAKIGGPSGYEANVQYAQLQAGIVIQTVKSYDTVPSPVPVVPTTVVPTATAAPTATATTAASVAPTTTSAPAVETTVPAPSPSAVTPLTPVASPSVVPFSFAFLKRQIAVEDAPFTGTDEEAVALFKQMVTQACASVGLTPLF